MTEFLFLALHLIQAWLVLAMQNAPAQKPDLTRCVEQMAWRITLLVTQGVWVRLMPP